MKAQSQIRDFIILLSKDKQALTLFQGDYIYKGIFDGYEPSQNSIRIGLTRAFNLLGGNKVEVQFETGTKYSFFFTSVMNTYGLKVFLFLPAEIIIHVSRGAVRINVEKQNLICSLSLPVSLADKFARIEKDASIQDKDAASLHRELGRLQPRVPDILRSVKNLMLQRADDVKVVLSGKEQLFFPAVTVFEKLRKPLFIPDATNAEGLMKYSEESELYALFPNYLQLENQIPGDHPIPGRGVDYWAEQLKARDVLSEVYVPVIIQNTVAGWMYAAIKPGSKKVLSEEDIYFFMSMAEIISEALIMRTLTTREEQESFRIRVYDVSESGLCLSVTDPIFVKLLRHDTFVKVTFFIFGKPVTLAARVVRALNIKDEKEFMGFTITVDFMNTASQDKVWYRRFINHLLTQGGRYA